VLKQLDWRVSHRRDSSYCSLQIVGVLLGLKLSICESLDGNENLRNAEWAKLFKTETIFFQSRCCRLWTFLGQIRSNFKNLQVQLYS